MNILLIILVTLLSYLLIWYVANVIVYYLSIAFKKPVIFESFSTISTLFLWLYNAIIGGVLIWIGIDLLINRQFLWFVAYLFIGSSVIRLFFNILELPFLFILAYFSAKLEAYDFNENVVEAEVLDENKQVIGKTEGDSSVSRRLAIYLLLFYVINLIELFIFPNENQSYQWGDYLVTPFLQIIGGTIIVGVPYAIYHKIRYKSFMQSDRRYFLIQVWKIWLVIFVILSLLGLFLRMAS